MRSPARDRRKQTRGQNNGLAINGMQMFVQDTHTIDLQFEQPVVLNGYAGMTIGGNPITGAVQQSPTLITLTTTGTISESSAYDWNWPANIKSVSGLIIAPSKVYASPP